MCGSYSSMGAMMKYKYEVQGMGQFPDDMLRYDQAKIIGIETNHDTKRKVYTILGNVTPTTGRWNSFLWSVSNVKKVKEV